MRGYKPSVMALAARSVDRNCSPIFAVCRSPKYIRLCHNMRETLQF